MLWKRIGRTNLKLLNKNNLAHAERQMYTMTLLAILAIILAFIFIGIFSDGSSESKNEFRNHGDYCYYKFVPPKTQKSNRYSADSFEEDSSIYDCDGIEYIIDDDRYCEDCDDYHDDY